MNTTRSSQNAGTVDRNAVNGHRMTYRVTGTYDDGTPRTSQYDAQHSSKCPCHTHA
jgi:hypothetical protein